MPDTTIKTASGESAPAEVEAAGEARAERTFSISIAISAVRCTFTYVLFPLVFPFVGEATGVGPAIGVTVGLIAIIANVYSIRRFQRAGHRWKWQMTLINGAVIALLVFLMANDIASLID